jgi:hypothetical protein
MTIKKSYAELVEFLEANKNKKVSTILDEIYSMTSQKSMSRTYLTNEQGEVFAIFCYYHKQWELLSEVDYGSKASSTTGYNTMCKIGVKHWTAQNKQAKAVGGSILTMLEAGEITSDEISDTRERLLAETKVIITDDMPVGYATPEDAADAYTVS